MRFRAARRLSRVAAGMATVMMVGVLGGVGSPVNAAVPQVLPPKVEEVTHGIFSVDPSVPPFVTAAIHPGDIIRNGEAGLVVPEPGQGVSAVVDSKDAVHGGQGPSEIAVETNADGTVSVFPAGEAQEARDPNAPSGGGEKCNDDFYNAGPHTWSSSMHWEFKKSSTPSYLAERTTEDTVIEATKNIVNVRNDCGLGNSSQAAQTYDGATNGDVVQIQTDWTCGQAGDGTSGISFKDMNGTSSLGGECTWWGSNGHITESDVVLDKTGTTWYNDLPTGCTSDYSLEATVTHERGHSYGLQHVGEPTHGRLTMSTMSDGPCQNSEASLGWGDWKGVRYLY